MGIQEKKQQREIEEFVTGEGLADLRSATGNGNATCTFAPSAEMSVDHLRIVYDNAKQFFRSCVGVCEDADYKGEIAKLSTFALTAVPQVERKDTSIGAYLNIDVSGATMNVELCGHYDASGGSTQSIAKLIQSKF